MTFTPVLEPTRARPRIQHRTGPALKVILKNNFSLSSLVLFGAVLQSLLALILPLRFAVIPTIVVFLVRIFDHVLMIYKLKPNSYMSDVLLGKYSYQVPDASGHFSSDFSAEAITVFMLSVRSNHPAGNLAPKSRQMGKYSRLMDKELEELDQRNSGFLGKTGWINSTDRDGGNEMMSISYWRSPEHVRAYAHHGKVHQEGWDWFNKEILQQGVDYISISHDLFSVPKGHWENIYINFQPTSLGAARFLKSGKEKGEEDMWVRGIVDARRGQLRHSAGRMTSETVVQPEKYLGSVLDV